MTGWSEQTRKVSSEKDSKEVFLVVWSVTWEAGFARAMNHLCLGSYYSLWPGKWRKLEAFRTVAPVWRSQEIGSRGTAIKQNSTGISLKLMANERFWQLVWKIGYKHLERLWERWKNWFLEGQGSQMKTDELRNFALSSWCADVWNGWENGILIPDCYLSTFICEWECDRLAASFGTRSLGAMEPSCMGKQVPTQGGNDRRRQAGYDMTREMCNFISVQALGISASSWWFAWLITLATW